jgi:peptidoglycan/xylan/chitin deacetylase (PgdA/CDA1 family)
MASLVDLTLRGLAGAAATGAARGRLSILIYHRVRAEFDPLNNWDPTQAEFDRQMQLMSRSFNVLPLEEAAARLAAGTLPARAACVTFDDGYADNVHAALPCLLRHGIPATFFIATGYLDGGAMWNDRVVEAVRAYPGTALDLRGVGQGVLPCGDWAQRRAAAVGLLDTWKHLEPAAREAHVAALEGSIGAGALGDLMMRAEDLQTLRRAGMAVGAHTVSHPILARIGDEAARDEIVASRDRIAGLLGEPVTLFAYPNGKPVQDYAAVHVRMAREAGFRVAVSTAPGAASRDDDPLQLPRFTPWQREPLPFGLSLIASRRGARPARA